MQQLDESAVDRWAAATLGVPAAGFPAYGAGPDVEWDQLELGEDERATLRAGLAAVRAALTSPVRAIPAARPDDEPAGVLQGYLSALAAGIGEARFANDEPAGTASPVSLATGLVAGAAAVQAGWPELPEAAAAHRAGLLAAETMAAGSDLAGVARSARAGLTTAGPGRAGRLLTRLLDGLVEATRPARTGPAVARCGALPGQNGGADFLAEITFTVYGPAALVTGLLAELRRLATEVDVWSDGDRHLLHVHSRSPGPAVAAAFAAAAVFDLKISTLDAVASD